MKNPLRIQILIPVLMLLIGTIVGITTWGMYAAGQSNRNRLKSNLIRVSKMLKRSRFTLNPWILEDMKGLSGGEFVVCDWQNKVSYSTLSEVEVGTVLPWRTSENLKPNGSPDQQNENSTFFTGQKVLKGKTFLVSEVILGRSVVPESSRIYVLFSESDYQDLWWESARIPLIVGLLAIPVSVLLVVLVSAEVTRPLKRLRSQIQEIAAGNWNTVQTSGKGDEIDELATSVNQMATRLAELEKQIRENERLGVLLQMGNGIAHNLRNSATGCRMAIEMHKMQLQNQLPEDDLEVAVGQLKLMEKYIQRFLTLGRMENAQFAQGECQLSEVVEDVFELLSPGARHQNVDLKLARPIPESIVLPMHRDHLEQVLINLINNGMEATGAGVGRETGLQTSLATQAPMETNPKYGGVDDHYKIVQLDWSLEGQDVQLTVWDNGPGPDSELQPELFDSFVTNKSGGIGLGLYITKQLTQFAGGDVVFQRQDRESFGEGTAFVVTVPLLETPAETGQE